MYEQYQVSELVYLDPIGAILISLYILFGWWSTGYGKCIYQIIEVVE